MKETNNQTPMSALRSYVIGFIVSLVLTFAAYIPVAQHSLATNIVVPYLIILALIQLVVQLVFFLHLGREAKPRFNLIFLMLTAGTILIVVIASIWIMTHLNYNMTPQQIHEYVHDQSGF